jgi:hypothetical protein
MPVFGRMMGCRNRRHSSGQSLVEFSLILLPFVILVVAILEFGFLFASYNSVSFASHDGAQLAAQYGNTVGADCAIVQQVEQDVSAPANKTQIQTIDIYWVDMAFSDGRAKSGYENLWTRGGLTHCVGPDGSKFDVPYTSPLGYPNNVSGYPEVTRCNLNGALGCVNPPHTGVDTVGVKITYKYKWISPFPGLVFGNGSAAGPTLVGTTIMRLEPVK